MVEDLAAQLFAEIVPNWKPENEHQKDTPKRFVKALRELTDRESEEFNFTTFSNPNTTKSEMVVVGPIKFYSLCAHHVLPFFGTAFVAYVPDERVAGLSKLARTVRWAAKGLWVQEDLTAHVADFISEQLDPIGTAVFMQAEHLCMTMRGVREPGALTTTTEMRGCFLDPTKQARSEFFGIINR